MLEEKDKYESSLHRRFVIRVLAPPFIALLVLFVVGLWQLDRVIHRQAINNLRSSATTTAATLEREFTLRETVLKQTGSELFIIKSEYNTDRTKLDENRDACRSYIQQRATFRGAPNGVCDPFLGGFASGGSSLGALENEYVKLGEEIIKDQNQRINERLSAFKQFFPETLGLLVVDKEKQPVSSALSGVFKGSNKVFEDDAAKALAAPIRGKLITAEGFELAIFAFPIPGGSVLAAYDLNNEHFIRQTWASAPVDRTRAVALILDSAGKPAYPLLKDAERFVGKNAELRQKKFVEFPLDKVDHTIVAAPAGASGWMVAVASPTAAVVAPSRDAQLGGAMVIGLFMIGFLWVGTFFIQRTLRNIVGLVSGAIVFGSGRLDYRIALDKADGEFLRLADTMNSMAQRISAAEQAINEKNREFISVATHELRAPLTAIIGYLSIFQDTYQHKLGAKGKETIDQVYYGTVRLRDLVNDMLNVARLESNRLDMELRPLSINTVVADVVNTMTVVAKMAKVDLSYKDTHAATVMADEQRLRIIINNFVSNAIKYNRPHGHVRIYHQLRNNQIVTVIEDDGLGIPEDQKTHLFEKFFRVKNADRKDVNGTGLGLYITKQYIEQMHGELWYESAHGKGTKFYFSLPIVKPKLRTRVKKLVKNKLSRKKQKE